jgi:hypothetical protein
MLQHKTIICSSEKFDDKFNSWLEEVNKQSRISIGIKSIKHDGQSHYILYQKHEEDWYIDDDDVGMM